MIELSYRGAIPKYIQVKESLVNLLDNNAFLPGETLPPVKEFSSRLAVNPRILQQAYNELVRDGYIYFKESDFYVARRDEVTEKRELTRKEENND